MTSWSYSSGLMFRVVVFKPQPPAVSKEETGLNSKQLSQISTKPANKS